MADVITDLSTDIGDRIARHRQRLGLTKRRLAELAALTPSAVSRYESGRNTPTLASLYRLADALRVMPWELLPDRRGCSIGERIERRRRKVGLTKRRLAELADLTPSTVDAYESSRDTPTLSELYRLASALRVMACELLPAYEVRCEARTSSTVEVSITLSEDEADRFYRHVESQGAPVDAVVREIVMYEVDGVEPPRGPDDDSPIPPSVRRRG